MKFNIYTKKIGILLLCIAGLIGCSVDDVKPINQLTDENVIRDGKSAQQVLNGVYSGWRQFNLGYYPILLGAEGNEGVLIAALTGSAGFNTNEVPVENPFLTEIYNAHYKIINQANFLIEELEAGKAADISEEKQKQLIAEAKFNRAFATFKLLRNFGEFYDMNSSMGIVLQTNFSNSVDAAPRNTVQEVYTQIFDDLEYAVAYGPKNVQHYYGGSLASKALLAKVKLYAKDYETASNLAWEVINNAEGYSLENSYSNIFANQMNSPEVIFAPFVGSGSEGGVAMSQIKQTNASAQLDSLANKQVEGQGELAGMGMGYDPRFLFAYSEATQGNNRNAKYPNENFVNGKTNTNYHLRLAEMYLIFAEAEVREEGDLNAALAALNTLRNRAGVMPKETNSPEELLELVREEKLLELFFENGENWFDLVRYHHYGDINAFDIKPTLNNKNQFIKPIPLKVLTANNQLEQNAGY
ncbi:RagB/SusD family nutrient uptake outer membrane protein [Salegentibacter maritimus]|uniref:RagB/SusD family nutrient uptake outer membrane protein n=1 Tax=Salegentibacter maritimus TaxID=2794347 RepID=UPI0018E4BB43|nr:RagB/SusD family nutrient uptake outer membrane protein [Salegentibacter maritimus]MBI6117548.1 RagB/SusD family nutrient uptake outer membrane protein [Salegentibacter maritimus]